MVSPITGKLVDTIDCSGSNEFGPPVSTDKQFYGIYDRDNLGVDLIEAVSEAHALTLFFGKNNMPIDRQEGYWAEDVEA
jgi:hypothetical protein